jgi:hypothetical protein
MQERIRAAQERAPGRFVRRRQRGGGSMGEQGPRRDRWRRTCAGLVAAGMLVAPGGAGAATSSAEITVTGGSLALSTPDFAGLSAVLTGATQTVSTTPSTPWSAVDARGTGAPWSVVASATDLVSTGSPSRVIPSANLSITTGPVAAGDGADPATGLDGASAASFAAPTGSGQTNVAVLSAPGPHRGAYSFTPRLDVTIPASALPSHPGVPYAATLTITIS